MITPEPLAALDLTGRVVALGVALWSLELLAVRAAFADGGVFAPAVAGSLRLGAKQSRRPDRWLYPALLVQLGAGVVVAAAGPMSQVGRFAVLALLIAYVAARDRRVLGGDGAEQLAAMVLVAAVLAALPVPSSTRVALAVGFIAAEVGLAYLTAGVAKAISPMWRSGAAIPAILATHSHGHPVAAALLADRPRLSRFVCWSVIAVESLFPLMLFGPTWLVVATLTAGLAFHAGCAVTMGLNSFPWSFVGSYPCLLAAIPLARSLF